MQVGWAFNAVSLADADSPALLLRDTEDPRPSSFYLVTLCGPITTGRLPTAYSIERVCHSRRPMGAPLPHSHRPPLDWGVSMQHG